MSANEQTAVIQVPTNSVAVTIAGARVVGKSYGAVQAQYVTYGNMATQTYLQLTQVS